MFLFPITDKPRSKDQKPKEQAINTILNTTEFPVDPDQAGQGTLIVTDAQLLVRPASEEPGRRRERHDTARARTILDLGNDMGLFEFHIISHADAETTHRTLDRLFHAYVEGHCYELWCDARVFYVEGDNTLRVADYGFSDGNYTMQFYVYCGIAEEQTEAFLATLLADLDHSEPFIVVRPDTSELGYTVRGYRL